MKKNLLNCNQWDSTSFFKQNIFFTNSDIKRVHTKMIEHMYGILSTWYHWGYPGKYRWKINIRQFNNKENLMHHKYKIMYLTHKDKLLNQSVYYI